MSERNSQGADPERLKEIEQRQDREGIPGYGQPPEEVRTTHLDDGPEFEWESEPKQETE